LSKDSGGDFVIEQVVARHGKRLAYVQRAYRAYLAQVRLSRQVADFPLISMLAFSLPLYSLR